MTQASTRASSPSATVVRATSSKARVIATAFWMVTESSASRIERGIDAQNLGSLYGKLLRVDVDTGDPYVIPPSNPFADQPGARPEIWAYGLRNPWRFSFDRLTGDLWIGDVHQVDEGSQSREVVDFQPASSAGGENYGFPIQEAFHCSGADPACRPPGVTLPIIGYEHNMNCSVTGGYVYRGPTATNLVGTYLFGDLCTGGVFAARSRGRLCVGEAPSSRDSLSAVRQLHHLWASRRTVWDKILSDPEILIPFAAGHYVTPALR